MRVSRRAFLASVSALAAASCLPMAAQPKTRVFTVTKHGLTLLPHFIGGYYLEKEDINTGWVLKNISWERILVGNDLQWQYWLEFELAVLPGRSKADIFGWMKEEGFVERIAGKEYWMHVPIS